MRIEARHRIDSNELPAVDPKKAVGAKPLLEGGQRLFGHLLGALCQKDRVLLVGRKSRHGLRVEELNPRRVDKVLERGVVDLQKSDVTIEPTGMWRTVRKMVFTRELGGEGLFRLGERKSYLLCTDAIVASYTSTGLTGLKFWEIYPTYLAPPEWYNT